jgi:hypothetical protein
MIDYFSKWPEAIPIKDKTAESVAKAIYNGWYCRHGIPYEIHTDQGPEFTNDLLQRLNGRMGVESRFTTPYNPQSNGEVERFNRTLIDSLSAYVSQCPGTWDKFLQGALFAYRTSPHPATGESPFVLMHGREARLPLDVIQSSAPELLRDINEYKMKLTIDLNKAHQIVREKLKEAAQSMKRKWDSRLRDPQSFEPGDRVLLYQPQIHANPNESAHSQKFKGNWKGPYEIVERRFGDDGSVYRIRDMKTNRETSMNVNKLRKLNSQTISLPDDHKLRKLESRTMFPQNLASADWPRPENCSASKRSDAQVEVATPIPSESPALEPVAVTPAMDTPGAKELTSKRKGKSRRIRHQTKQMKNNAQPQGLEDLAECPLEKIIEHTRGKHNRIYYRVRWEGHGPERDSWLPLDAFYTRDCLHDYWKTVDCPLREIPKAFRFVRHAGPVHNQHKRLKLIVRPP